MMKKFMQLSDDSMQMFFELLTDFPLDEVKTILAGHPKEAKVKLAKTIITEYNDAASADEAADRWQREIGSGGLPEEIPVAKISKSDLNDDGTLPAANLLKQLGLCASTSDARRSIQQGGAKMGEDKQKIETHDQAITVESGMLLWVGKKRFCQVELLD
ncbi:MAG: tyrosine--tRNA ligase, partial [Planctomycetaceae bacterium]|nr:tyrosine--tRNA ligase [Planctomycetaceae bacterium]